MPRLSQKAKDDIFETLLDEGFPVADVRSRGPVLFVCGRCSEKLEQRARALAVANSLLGPQGHLTMVPSRSTGPPRRRLREAEQAKLERQEKAARRILDRELHKRGKQVAQDIAAIIDGRRAEGPLKQGAGTKRLAGQLGALWGQAVVDRYQWKWLKLDRALAVVAPRHRYMVAPVEFMTRLLTEPAPGDNTAELLFNMLGGKRLPKALPFQLVPLQ